VEQTLGQADGKLFKEIWILREQSNGIEEGEEKKLTFAFSPEA